MPSFRHLKHHSCCLILHYHFWLSLQSFRKHCFPHCCCLNHRLSFRSSLILPIKLQTFFFSSFFLPICLVIVYSFTCVNVNASCDLLITHFYKNVNKTNSIFYIIMLFCHFQQILFSFFMYFNQSFVLVKQKKMCNTLFISELTVYFSFYICKLCSTVVIITIITESFRVALLQK